MVIVLVVVIVALLGALAALAARHIALGRRGADDGVPPPRRPRILLPFEAHSLSRRALDAALRLAHAEGATLVPVFLATVPRTVPLESALPSQADVALALQEAIEHRAAAFSVPVDARIERGRTVRHALREAIAHEHFERIVAAVSVDGEPGMGPEDVAWLLVTAPGEIVVLRPAPHVPAESSPSTSVAIPF